MPYATIGLHLNGEPRIRRGVEKNNSLAIETNQFDATLFLGEDEYAVRNADALIDVIQSVRATALARLVSEQADPITAAKAEADR